MQSTVLRPPIDRPVGRARASDRLDAAMKTVSQVGSVIGFGLMLAGFVAMWINGSASGLPGDSALPLAVMLHPAHAPLNMAVVSAGIIVLALIPVVKVVLALWLYLRRRDAPNSGISLVLFLELLVSTFAGGR